VYKNDAPTSISCTITNLATSAADLVNTATFATGDYVHVFQSENGGSTAAIGTVLLEWTE
jgi:hypothetical protein